MLVESKPSPAPNKRNTHESLPELVENVALGTAALEQRTDAPADFVALLRNAEYFLSFDLADFEPLLTKCPSPLRELGVGVSLRYSEGVEGELTIQDLRRARDDLLPTLPEDLRRGSDAGLRLLAKAVKARDRLAEHRAAGFSAYASTAGLSLHALRAMGRSNVTIDGVSDRDPRPTLPLGEPVRLKATDERGRPLSPPEVESRSQAPLLVREEPEEGERTVLFLVPGEYRVRVPGRASGDRKVFVA